ncbi:MAG: M64 family metallopeptidase [Ignavibacteriaceae bacterium]
MKFHYLILLFLIFVPLIVTAGQEINFNDYFTDKTLRIDYFHIGDANSEIITIDKVYSYGTWAGSLKNLADNFNNGRYYLKIYDTESGKLIYSKGFDTYFGEYKTSEWGLNGIKKAYHESAIIPQPKKKIRFALEQRNKENKLVEFYSTEIDPDDIMVVRDNIVDSSVKVFKSLDNGNPHTKVDVAILAEGYTAEEEDKFKADLERFTGLFFKLDPYKSMKDRFNVYGIFKPSAETGTDEPDAEIFKNTALNTTFYSLGSERYLLTEDNKAMRDMAAHVPYDALYIMVNHKRYGGGGIYNLFCTFTADNQWHEYLFLHEFGHSFAGLADEYYTSDVAYNDFYPKGVEPVEPNITALLNPGDLKWKELASPGIELPTPWEKADYDALDLIWQAKRRQMNIDIAKLKREEAPVEKIREAEEEYDKADREHNKVINDYIGKSKFVNKVGAFEGAGYSAQGLYRPMLDCIMFSKGTKPFCKVCEQRIKEVIMHYSE